MWFYIGLILTIFVLSGNFKFSSATNRLTIGQNYVICFIIIILVSCVRFDIGYDYFNYYEIIYSAGGLPYLKEPISAVIMEIGHLFHYPPISFAIFAILIYFLIFKTLYIESSNYRLGIFIYICLFYCQSLSILRQALACAILFYGFKYIKSKNLKKYLMYVILATCAHSSGCIGLIIYFAYNYIKIWMLPIIFIIIKIPLMSIMQFIAGFDIYTTGTEAIINGQNAFEGGTKVLYVFLSISIILFIIKNIYKIKVDNKIFSIIFTGALIPFIIGPHYGNRVSLYFNIYLCILSPKIIDSFKLLQRTLIMSVFALYFIIYIRAGWGSQRAGIGEYKTIFQIENIEKPHFRGIS